MMSHLRVLGIAVLALFAACATDAPPAESDVPSDTVTAEESFEPAVQLVDTTIAPAVAGEAGWNYQQVAEADFDGDSILERVVLTAQVELVRGRPAWEDGHQWQVYIESRDGQRTYVYAQRIQLGTLTMRVGLNSEGRAVSVILIEHSPDLLSLYEVSYLGPNRVAVGTRFQRGVDPRGETASPKLP